MNNRSNCNFLYIIYISIIIYNLIFQIKPAGANIYKVENVQIIEPYNLEFKKEKVIDQAFLIAFKTLITMIINSNDLSKINFKEITNVKPMIDSFSITDEKFSNNQYIAKFNILFDKESIFDYLNQKNILSSLPIRKNILFIPVYINLDNDEHYMFNQNNFYNYWNKNEKNFFLLKYLLPSEDIEEFNLINKNIKNIENYDFQEILKKYDYEDYIIAIFFFSKNNLKVLSKINLNNEFSIINSNFKNVNIKMNNFHDDIIFKMKSIYENKWKSINKINTSIKLKIYVSVNSKKYNLINRFENQLNKSNLVSKYSIIKITNKKTIYKIIYNNSPDRFIKNFRNKNFKINTNNNIWDLN